MSKLCQKFEKAGTLIGKPWVHMIVYELLQGPKRFSELEFTLEITARMLSERLKQLEQEGILKRRVLPQTPVKIEYSLTKKGHTLKPIIESLRAWSQDWY